MLSEEKRLATKTSKKKAMKKKKEALDFSVIPPFKSLETKIENDNNDEEYHEAFQFDS